MSTHAFHVLEHLMYGYRLLVPKNQGLFSKISKERNMTGYIAFMITYANISNSMALRIVPE